jgi:hypothetical protein
MGRKANNMVGRPFGYWKVVNPAEPRTNAAGTRRYVAWVCECRCGAEKTLTSKVLLSGTSRSCGCGKTQFQKEAAVRRHPDSAMRRLISVYRSSAKSRSLCWELTYFQATLLFGSNCHYCGVAPRNGIDRVDSAKGYFFDNCVPCCAICNRMKLDLDKEEFLRRCARIARRHNVLAEGAAC